MSSENIVDLVGNPAERLAGASLSASTDLPPVVAIVGPTATGKSDLALDVAEYFGKCGDGAEIVNADAMQLYAGMDIGTAKLPPAERRGVPHHQFDVLAVTEEASVAAYQRHARADIAAIRERGRAVVVAGGSGLYIRALVDVIDFPGTDPALRAELENRAKHEGTDVLYAELAHHDPAAASRIEPANTRRIIRALEVITLTGRPFSASLPQQVYALPGVRQFGLDLPDDQLDERISRRVDTMLDAGLADEVHHLEAAGLRRSRTASRAIGYAQMLACFDGELAPGEVRGLIALKTRQLSRYQRKWFRRDPRITWLDPADPLAACEAALA